MIAAITTCACGASYEAFRAVDDEGHPVTYASARAMLRVGSDDPELWRSKGRGAVLALWGDLKRAQWEVTHGYCDAVAIERATVGDTSFDVETFDNAAITPVATERCACDHCNPERWMRAAGLIKEDHATSEHPSDPARPEAAPRPDGRRDRRAAGARGDRHDTTASRGRVRRGQKGQAMKSTINLRRTLDAAPRSAP